MQTFPNVMTSYPSTHAKTTLPPHQIKKKLEEYSRFWKTECPKFADGDFVVIDEKLRGFLENFKPQLASHYWNFRIGVVIESFPVENSTSSNNNLLDQEDQDKVAFFKDSLHVAFIRLSDKMPNDQNGNKCTKFPSEFFLSNAVFDARVFIKWESAKNSKEYENLVPEGFDISPLRNFANSIPITDEQAEKGSIFIKTRPHIKSIVFNGKCDMAMILSNSFNKETKRMIVTTMDDREFIKYPTSQRLWCLMDDVFN